VWSAWVEEGEAAMVARGFAAANGHERDQEMGRERMGRARLGHGREWPQGHVAQAGASGWHSSEWGNLCGLQSYVRPNGHPCLSITDYA
jgi:hypothetical protein